MGYLFEREGLAAWIKEANRYALTDKGIALLNAWSNTMNTTDDRS